MPVQRENARIIGPMPNLNDEFPLIPGLSYLNHAADRKSVV